MHYTEKLKNEIAELKKDSEDKRQIVISLFVYLSNKKFHCGDKLDGYVSVSDVLHRLQDII